LNSGSDTSKRKRAGEFQLIERYFAPLAAKAEGAFGLHNDAAVLPVAAGERLIATVDTMIQGRHFLDCPPDLVARKLLRVNLSDLAAMGAEPFGYLLASAWPLDIEEAWIAEFSRALAADQQIYGIGLYGGDTTGTPGPMTLSLTAFGKVASGFSPSAKEPVLLLGSPASWPTFGLPPGRSLMGMPELNITTVLRPG